MNANTKYIMTVAASQFVVVAHLINLFGQKTLSEFWEVAGFDTRTGKFLEEYWLYAFAVEQKKTLEWLSSVIALVYFVVWMLAGYLNAFKDLGKWLFNVFSPRCALLFLVARPVVYLFVSPIWVIPLTFLLVNTSNYEIVSRKIL